MLSFGLSLILLAALSAGLTYILGKRGHIYGWKRLPLFLAVLTGAVLGNWILPEFDLLVQKYLHFHLLGSMAGALVFYYFFSQWIH